MVYFYLWLKCCFPLFLAMVMYVNDFETQRNETTYTPLYISYCRSFPAFFFFLRGRGRGQSVHLQPRITDLSWADFNFIWTSQSQRAHVTLHLCFWISFERYIARAFFSWKKEHPRNVWFFPSFSTHILIKLPFTRLVALHNFFS